MPITLTRTRHAHCRYAPVQHLIEMKLCEVPRRYLPLSSVGSRETTNNVSRFLLTELRTALNNRPLGDPSRSKGVVDCIVVSGGNIRGEREYVVGPLSST